MTHYYEIVIDGSVVKEFSCKRPETAYNRYNKFAAQKGYTTEKYDKDAYGMMVWMKGVSKCTLIYKGSH